MIDIKAVARPLAPTHPSQRAIQTVAKPVEAQAKNHEQQSKPVVARKGIRGAGSYLRGQPERRQMVGVDPCRSAPRQPFKRALFERSSQRLIHARRGAKRWG